MYVLVTAVYLLSPCPLTRGGFPILEREKMYFPSSQRPRETCRHRVGLAVKAPGMGMGNPGKAT